MKLLYIHQYFATPNSNGGTRSYEMAKRLVKKGHSVSLITSSAFIESQFELKSGWNQISFEGIDLHIYHLPYSNHDSFIKRIYKFIAFSFVSTRKAFSLEKDLIFATSTPLTIAIPALLNKLTQQTPYVFEVRDLWPKVPIAMGVIKSAPLKYLLTKFEKLTYKHAKSIIALSPGMKAGIVKTGVDANTITVVPNSCDTALFSKTEQEVEKFKADIPYLAGRKLALYAGTFGQVNRVDYIVHLAKASLNQGDKTCFVAIGSGACKTNVIDLAEREKVLNKNLFILDPIEKKEITNWFNSADLCFSFVGPTEAFWDNSANKVFDSLAAGTPVAINHQGWQKDFIENSSCGLVLNEDITLSVRSMNEFLHDPTRYDQAKAACYELSHNDFSRDKLFEKFEAVLINAKGR